MSRWTHAICSTCYRIKEGQRPPVTVEDAPLESCCYCSAMTVDGIYYRDDPVNTRSCNHKDKEKVDG